MGKKKSVEKEPIVQGDWDIAANGIMGNRVMICLSKTINLGNYQSIRVENAGCRTVQDGESFKAAKTILFDQVTVGLCEMIEIAKEVFGNE